MPDFTNPPQVDHPPQGDPRPWWVLSQEHMPSGDVRVTAAIRPLRRVRLTVPYDSWVDGEHLRSIARLAELLPQLGEPGAAD